MKSSWEEAPQSMLCPIDLVHSEDTLLITGVKRHFDKYIHGAFKIGKHTRRPFRKIFDEVAIISTMFGVKFIAVPPQ